jgi:glycerol uptake facilitator-like aquaporin
MPGFVLAQIFGALAAAALAAWLFPRASSTDSDPLSH